MIHGWLARPRSATRISPRKIPAHFARRPVSAPLMMAITTATDASRYRRYHPNSPWLKLTTARASISSKPVLAKCFCRSFEPETKIKYPRTLKATANPEPMVHFFSKDEALAHQLFSRSEKEAALAAAVSK